MIESAGEPRIPVAVVADRFPCDELEFVGRGGQSDVWRARQDGADEMLRILVNVTDPRRVEREVDALETTSSPHLMKFYGLEEIEHDGRRHAVIRGEYIAGGTVADKLEDGVEPTTEQALTCTQGTLRALVELHRADLVHRDIKPANISLRRGDWARAVVLDLGYVRNLNAAPITIYPQQIGTVPFMAPEQLLLRPAGLRSDIYAAGILLYLLVAGRHPFVADDEEVPYDEYLERMESQDWPNYDALDLPDEAIDLVADMLAFDQHERPRARRALARVDEILEEL